MLNKVQNDIEEGKNKEALEKLEKIISSGNLKDYDAAVIFQTIGFVQNNLGDFKAAADNFTKALSYNALPSDLKKRVYNLKNYDQRRDAHPEGNVLKHTIAVTNRALQTGDIDFALAALFHDIGKDETAGIHPKKGHITHFGHEHVSAKLVKKYAKWLKSMSGNPVDIYYIVKQHDVSTTFIKSNVRCT